MERKIQISIRLTNRQLRAINEEAERTQLRPNDIVRRWLDLVIDSQPAVSTGLRKMYGTQPSGKP